MFWKKSSTSTEESKAESTSGVESASSEARKQKPVQVQSIEQTTIIKPIGEELLSCEHYEYEYFTCKSLKRKLIDYYRGEPSKDCNYYGSLHEDCLKWLKDPLNSMSSYAKMKNYENELIKKRNDALSQNDVWTLRSQPPSDWNAPLPDWCLDRLKDTYWYKISDANASSKAS
jgi:hypothetical protein